jgi:membrane protein YdbS with pleckstrin-like domain
MEKKTNLLKIYKPNKSSFFLYNLTLTIFLYFIVFSIIYTINYFTLSLPLIFFILPLIFLILISAYSKQIQYNKLSYEFYPNKIIEKGGSIFSDYEIELSIKNITHISLVLPYLKNKLFNVGHLIIESAGSNTTKIYISDVLKSEIIYKQLSTLMQDNGFSLKKEKLIQEEKPATIGIILEISSYILSGLFILFFTIIPILPALFTVKNKILVLIIFIIIFFLITIAISAFIIFTYLDLKKRRYKLYSDTITYSEGFLTKHYSFIPIENLANSSINQTFWEKLFNLYDVLISCQGSGNEIKFKNMLNGEKFEKNLDDLIKTKSTPISKEIKKNESSLTKTKEIKTKDKKIDTTSTAHYKIDLLRSILPSLIFIGIFIFISLIILILKPKLLLFMIPFSSFILFTFIFGGIMFLLKVKFTDYYIQENSINEKYNFLTKKNIEFNNEKITGVIFKQNFIDYFFKTCSVVFWSIGADSNLTFKNIKKTESLEEILFKKFGIKNINPTYEIRSKFSFLDMLKKNFFLTLFSIFLITTLIILANIFTEYSIFFYLGLVLILLLYILITIYNSYYYPRSYMQFFREHTYFREGILNISEYYTLLDNIKDIKTLKFPFSAKGFIQFNVAGDFMIDTGKQQVPISCQFTINYVDKIENKDELIDYIFENKPDKTLIQDFIAKGSKDKKIILYAKPSIANPLFILITTSIILFPLILLLPVSVPYLIYYIRLKSYTIESTRLVQNHGVFYKTQTSIIFSKIDFINSDRGFLNKMFSNGNITVNTAGSRLPELIIKNIPNYKEFYNKLKEFY